MNILKNIFIPNGETVSLEAHDIWEVRWYSMTRTTRYSGSPRPQCEVFITEEDARKFSQELIMAAELLKDTGGDMLDGNWRPKVTKNSYRGRS